MGATYDLFKKIADTFPVLKEKTGTVLLLFFTFGMLFGYMLSRTGNATFLLGPLIAKAFMWRDLDEGFLVFLLFLVIAIFFPQFVPHLI
ncbi:MAG: hypothetical protein J7L14_03410 [Candidatus Diapherotrites archaeon]|nr:hypothetical protein [Candidatus Diapherotrites archaeon]